jgi:hypothetical protein
MQISVMRLPVLYVFACLLVCHTSFAQNATLKRFTAPLAGTVVLRDVEDKYNAYVQGTDIPDANEDKEQLQRIKAYIEKNYPHKKKAGAAKSTTSVPPPTVGLSFAADSGSGTPSDNYCAINMHDTGVTVMNSIITVHNVTTGAPITRKSLKSFSSSVGLNTANDFRYDPKVIYDPEADKFICVMLDGTDSFNWIILGFSQTSNPSGAWNFYKFFGNYANDTTWFDYPAISVTHNEFFLTGNKLVYGGSWQTGFVRSVIYQVRKADGYAGAAALHYQIWDSIRYDNSFVRYFHTLSPSNAITGPEQYFISNHNFGVLADTVFIIKVPDTIGSADTILTVTPVVATGATYSMPPNGRQPDTSYVLQTNDARITGGFIKDNELQFVNASLDPSNGSSAVYHGVITNFKTAPVLTGRLYSFDSLDLGYPNISYTGSVGGVAQSIISFDYTGPNTMPGLGAMFFDGSNYSDMVRLRTGDSSIHIYYVTGREQRWGDYSGSQYDWSAPGTVWVNGIYGRRDHNYGNYMAELVSPYEVGVPVIHTPVVPPAKLYPNPTEQFVSFEFNVGKEQLFTFNIYDMQGRLIDKVLDNFCHEGQNVLRFNIAPLAPGTYILKAVGAQGENIPAQTFVRR